MMKMFEGLSVSANKKLNKWIQEKVNLSMETRNKNHSVTEKEFTDYWNRSIQINLEKVLNAKGDYHKMCDIFIIAANKDNKMTRILVDDLYFKNGSSSLSLSNKAYKAKVEEFLIDYFGKVFVEERKKEESEMEAKLLEAEALVKEEEEKKRKIDNLVIAYHNCKGYIDFLKKNEGFQVVKKASGKLGRLCCVNFDSEQYFKAKKNNVTYKYFQDIMKYAYENHDGDIYKAIKWIEEYF